ncbi:MAG: putative baseplate assembly protein [Motilibacteraceae bacterium]
MALPAPNLDDRRFQDLVDEAKRAIPRHCPEWTNHNLNDPGVALIELFAWMSDQLLYRLNQVPDRLYTHFLNLVGIEPFPPGVARTDLTFWLSAALDQVVTVPAGTAVATAGDAEGSAVVFTTTEDLAIAPPRLSALRTTTGPETPGRDVLEDVRLGVPVPCFPSDPLAPGEGLYLGFAEPMAGSVLQLSVQATAEGIGVDPTDPPLAWEVWAGEGWLRVAVLEDETGGLNRDGRIVLLLPQVHEALTIGGVRAHWLRVVLLEPRPGQPTYQRSPQLRALQAATIGGTVHAEHAEQVVAEALGRSDGRPGQLYRTSRFPVLSRRGEERVLVREGGQVTGWTEVADFSQSGPADRHVVWDSATGEVRFGPAVRYADGSVVRHGAAPGDGAEISVTPYRVGGGSQGNVGAGTLTRLRTPVPYVTGVTNLLPSTGGGDAETVAEAKARGPLTLRTGMRAVTAGDYERLAQQASVEVARSRCLPPAAPGGPVRVLVVPQVRKPATEHGIDDFALDDTLLGQVRTYLDERRVVGTALEIGTPYYQGVSVAALLLSSAGRPPALVRQRAVDTIAAYLNPLTGGADGTGWPFDADLTTAVLAQLLESVDGVERVEELLLFEYDLRTRRRLGPGRDVLRLEPHSLFLSAAPSVVVR